MVDIKINGISYAIPVTIEDVTIGKFIELRSIERTDLNVIHWAIGANPIFKETKTINNELSNVIALTNKVVIDIIDFMSSDKVLNVPKSIDVMGYDVQLKNGLLDSLPYWPYEVVKTIIANEGKKETFDPTDQYPRIIGHYLYEAVTKNPYDESKAEEFINDVAVNVSMTQAIQLGNFFLHKFKSILSKKQQNLIRKPRMTTLRLA